MATTPFTSLIAGTSTASADILAFVDVSDSSQSPQGSTLKITIANLFGTVPVPIIVTSTTAPQFKLAYDGSNFLTVTVSSAGAVSIAPTGSGKAIATAASVPVTINGKLIASSAGDNLRLTADGTDAKDGVVAASGLGVLFFGHEANAELQITALGTITASASTTTRAGFNLLPGAAPTAPTNGDMWTTSAGLFVRINGATVGPLS